MKPNDQAYQAAQSAILKAIAKRSCIIAGVPFNENNYDEFDAGEAAEHAKVAVDAAYAAQFQSEDYAGLIKDLRTPHGRCLDMRPDAADAIETLLAERDAGQRKQEETAKILGLAVDAILNRPTPVDGVRRLTPDEQDILSKVIRRAKEEKERDALAARLAPVDDEALVERDDFAEQIALRSENGISKDLQEFLRKFKEDDSAAIRMFAQYRDLEIEMDSWKSLWEKTNAHMRQVEAERDALAARLAPVDNEALVAMVVKEFIEATTDMPPRTTYTISERSLTGVRAAIAAIRPHIEAAERERCAKIAELHSYPMKTVAGTGYNNAAKEISAAIRRGK